MNWQEIDRLRHLVSEGADRHLANWAEWSQRYRVGIGYRRGSSSFAGGGMDVEDLERQVDAWSAQTANAVIDGLPIHLRRAIETVYAGATWNLRAELLDVSLIEAAELFAQRARQKGLTT